MANVTRTLGTDWTLNKQESQEIIRLLDNRGAVQFIGRDQYNAIFHKTCVHEEMSMAAGSGKHSLGAAYAILPSEIAEYQGKSITIIDMISYRIFTNDQIMHRFVDQSGFTMEKLQDDSNWKRVISDILDPVAKEAANAESSLRGCSLF